MHPMRITILGSGTSHGVPVIGCDCPVCRSGDQRDRRTRCSAWVQHGDASILIDTSTDFRTQALRERIRRLDAILFTHPHADHLHGLDDTRSLSRDGAIPLYATEPTEREIRSRFAYIFTDTQPGGGKPRVRFVRIDSSPKEIAGLVVEPIPVFHGVLPIVGFRIGEFAYITDCSRIPDSSFHRLEGVRFLVIGALRDRPHPTHFTVAEAAEAAKRIGADHTWLTHLCHDLDHRSLASRLPEGIAPAYDGLVIEADQ